jgi:hypothetical protein
MVYGVVKKKLVQRLCEQCRCICHNSVRTCHWFVTHTDKHVGGICSYMRPSVAGWCDCRCGFVVKTKPNARVEDSAANRAGRARSLEECQQSTRTSMLVEQLFMEQHVQEQAVINDTSSDDEGDARSRGPNSEPVRARWILGLQLLPGYVWRAGVFLLSRNILWFLPGAQR